MNPHPTSPSNEQEDARFNLTGSEADLRTLSAPLNEYSDMDLHPELHRKMGEDFAKALRRVIETAALSTPSTPDPEARLLPEETELCRELQGIIDAYGDGTHGTPRPMSHWLRALADKLDPDCPDDEFVEVAVARVQAESTEEAN